MRAADEPEGPEMREEDTQLLLEGRLAPPQGREQIPSGGRARR